MRKRITRGSDDKTFGMSYFLFTFILFMARAESPSALTDALAPPTVGAARPAGSGSARR